jgi:hypothetical protein
VRDSRDDVRDVREKRGEAQGEVRIIFSRQALDCRHQLSFASDQERRSGRSAEEELERNQALCADRRLRVVDEAHNLRDERLTAVSRTTESGISRCIICTEDDIADPRKRSHRGEQGKHQTVEADNLIALSPHGPILQLLRAQTCCKTFSTSSSSAFRSL